MAYSGADPDLLAAYAAQTLNAADALAPVEGRLHELEATIARAVPHAPKIGGLVDRFVRHERRTRELGERVGAFGKQLRVAMGGPPPKGAPIAMHGLLFVQRADSPPRPVGWETWTAAQRTAFVQATDPQRAKAHHDDGFDLGDLADVAKVVGEITVNAAAGAVDGVTNTVTFGLAPDIGPVFEGGAAGVAYTLGRVSGTVATAVAAPQMLGKAVPVLAEQTFAGFAARRGVDAVVGMASAGGSTPRADLGDMVEGAATGIVTGGVLDGAASAYTAMRLRNIEPTVIAHGFDSVEQWQQFGDKLHDGLAAAGYPEARAAVQGSGATGKGFTSGLPFDEGRISDLDIAVGSSRLLEDAQAAAGFRLRSGGMRTPPIPNRTARDLGLQTLLVDVSKDMNRPVKIMVYRSLDDAVAHKPSIPLPKK